MAKKTFHTITLIAAIFIALIFYNYSRAQTAIKDTKPAPFGISLVSYPDKVAVGEKGSFIWQVDATSDRTLSYTSIYWGYESSPSALSISDSPEAVGYPYSDDDYHGDFGLPSSFSSSIRFDTVSTVFFRAYARVGIDHFWSEEKQLEVIQP